MGPAIAGKGPWPGRAPMPAPLLRKRRPRARSRSLGAESAGPGMQEDAPETSTRDPGGVGRSRAAAIDRPGLRGGAGARSQCDELGGPLGGALGAEVVLGAKTAPKRACAGGGQPRGPSAHRRRHQPGGFGGAGSGGSPRGSRPQGWFPQRVAHAVWHRLWRAAAVASAGRARATVRTTRRPLRATRARSTRARPPVRCRVEPAPAKVTIGRPCPRSRGTRRAMPQRARRLPRSRHGGGAPSVGGSETAALPAPRPQQPRLCVLTPPVARSAADPRATVRTNQRPRRPLRGPSQDARRPSGRRSYGHCLGNGAGRRPRTERQAPAAGAGSAQSTVAGGSLRPCPRRRSVEGQGGLAVRVRHAEAGAAHKPARSGRGRPGAALLQSTHPRWP